VRRKAGRPTTLRSARMFIAGSIVERLDERLGRR
jgi:hypothetical protein